MSMTAALENFSAWRERQRARLEHDRLQQHHDDEEEQVHAVDAAAAAGSPNDNGVPSAVATTTTTTEATTVTTPSSSSSSSSSTTTASPSDTAAAAEETRRRRRRRESQGDDEENIMLDPEILTIHVPRASSTLRTTVSLEELQEERELARRRTGACVLCAVLVLFLLWIEALTSGDFGQLLLCLVGTSWTARWIRHNREREEELDRRIAHYLEHAEPGVTEVNRADLRMLSFQAQLALAIMESQRQMMLGGYGHPDGGIHDTPGVSEQARSRWERFTYKTVPNSDASPPAPESKKGSYGSVAGKAAESNGEEKPHCSICLSEYEEGEKLVCLPCRHIYHEECVSSWTSNHTRCPLCNFDLESAAEASAAGASSSRSPPPDSYV